TVPIPIQPTAHYAMGGIPTNVSAEVLADAAGTVVPGLYAAGECACVGVHGANRLGTNSLLDIVVFGKRGGRAMAEFVRTAGLPVAPPDAEAEVADRVGRLIAGTGDQKTAAVRAELQSTMTEHAFVYRTADSLAAAAAKLAELRLRVDALGIDDSGPTFNYDLTEALELGYLLDLAEATVASAAARTESRGAHFRTDHPTRDDAGWMRHTLATRRADGTITLTYKPVVGGRHQPVERKY
ncbi:MAG: FAD-binding protein, partial [Acidimicrobiales bacterium]